MSSGGATLLTVAPAHLGDSTDPDGYRRVVSLPRMTLGFDPLLVLASVELINPISAE